MIGVFFEKIICTDQTVIFSRFCVRSLITSDLFNLKKTKSGGGKSAAHFEFLSVCSPRGAETTDINSMAPSSAGFLHSQKQAMVHQRALDLITCWARTVRDNTHKVQSRLVD